MQPIKPIAASKLTAQIPTPKRASAHRSRACAAFAVWATRVVTPLLCAVLFAGCQAVQSQGSAPELDSSEPIVLLPFLNRSETPLAGERAQAIALSVLRRSGLTELQSYDTPPESGGLPILDDAMRLAAAKQAARLRGARHALTGSVEEWRYKSGLDGEPAVGLSLRLVDLDSNQIVWSGSAARSGWSRESLAGTAQKVLQELANDFLVR